MTHLACCTPFPTAPPCGGGGRRPTRGRLASFIAALSMATLGCRGDDAAPTGPDPGPASDVTPAHALAFRDVSAGLSLTCGVTTHAAGDVAYCWGDNTFGQLGTSSSVGPEDCSNTPCSTHPARVARGLAFRIVSAGSSHACGVTTDNVAYCWGLNDEGQLGTGTNTGPEKCLGEVPCSPRPVRVLRGLAFRQLSAGGRQTCGVTLDNLAYCWGSNAFGQLGVATETGPESCGEFAPCSTRPVRVAGNLRFRRISVGHVHTCGVTTNNLAYCWGINDQGELGSGTNTGPRACIFEVPCSPRPVRVVGGLSFSRVNAGSSSHTCGLTTTGVTYCWGENTGGQLGIGTSTQKSKTSPVRVVGRLAFNRINAGGFHTCGVTTEDIAYCWGENLDGQLGDGTDTGPEDCLTTVCSPRPVPVVGGLAFEGVQAGHFHSCGVTTANVAYCWGQNFIGELGDGTLTMRNRPVAVLPPRR
jgi:alpha-tubulin suppressor-like RCC1 family protein